MSTTATRRRARATRPRPVRELLQPPQRVVRIAEGLDPIVVGVPSDKLRLDVVESVPVFVDGEQDRQGHLARNPNAVDAP